MNGHPPVVHIVEDDVALRNDLATFLTMSGHASSVASDLEQIVEEIVAVDPALVLLDLGLPGIDGLHVCRALRAASAVPVIVLTSRSTDIDELMTITLGADDFVAKPFSPQVLLARIAAVLRRSGGKPSRILRHREVLVDLDASTATCAGRSVELSRNARKTLEVLLAHPGTVVSREQLMTALWESGDFVDDNTLTVTVNRLRRALQSIGAADFIRTVRGEGYRT